MCYYFSLLRNPPLDISLCPPVTSLLLCPLCYKLFTRAIFIVFNPSLPVLFLKHFTGVLTPITVLKLFLKRSLLTFSLQNPVVSSWFSSYLVYKQPFTQSANQSFLIYCLHLTSRAVHSPFLIFYFLVTSSPSPVMISFFSVLPPRLGPWSSSVLYIHFTLLVITFNPMALIPSLCLYLQSSSSQILDLCFQLLV